MNTKLNVEHSALLAGLQAALPKSPLFKERDGTLNENKWLLATKPFELDKVQVTFLNNLGGVLYRFMEAVQVLYQLSLQTGPYDWVRHVFHAGKPETLIKFSQMECLQHSLHNIIRPDLLLTDDGFVLIELELVVGGIGFTAALSEAYRAVGFDPIDAPEGISKAFLKMLQALKPDIADPHIAIVISDESEDYRLEMQWLVNKLQAYTSNIHLVDPKKISLRGQILGFETAQGTFESIDVIYRFFELFDLPNIPQIEVIQSAIQNKLVICTPPFKPYMEEKASLALLHHPSLTQFWEKQLSPEDLSCLKKLIPESWLLDPAPQEAVIPPLNFNQKPFQQFLDLAKATKKERKLIIKPSGFSPLAWGSHGVIVGHNLSQKNWDLALREALNQFKTAPHILQRFAKTQVRPLDFFDPETNEVKTMEGRTRLCPYYFVTERDPKLVGILSTTCPKEYRIIHGMREAIFNIGAKKLP